MNRSSPKIKRTAMAAAVATSLAILPADAVQLSPGGVGQALIYPYYTVQSNAGNPFNTYISVVNTSSTAPKALRVRFREARNGADVASLNLYLGQNDVWTAAIVPDGQGTRLITADSSCTFPVVGPLAGQVAAPQGLAFSNAAYTGASDDGAGSGLDRTREGFLEILEMGELTGSMASAATHLASGFPANCSALGGLTAASVTKPTGGLIGSLTIINVANGQDFTVPAEALESLASQPYFRPVEDAYPSFAAAEIDPMSVVTTKSAMYRSAWARGVDAVTAVLMRTPLVEYAMDADVNAATDYLLTMPTRHLMTTATTAQPPFTPGRWQQRCGVVASGGTLRAGEEFGGIYFNREAQSQGLGNPGGFLGQTPEYLMLCGSTHVLTIENGTPKRVVLASLSETVSYPLGIRSGFNNGWMRLSAFESRVINSLPQSSRLDLATGVATQGAHTYRGLPASGIMVRSLQNGLLSCGGQTCQGNYGGSVPIAYERMISP